MRIAQGPPGGPPAGGAPPTPRQHTANSVQPVVLVPANVNLTIESIVTIFIEGDHRVIRANSIPNHAVGMFPNEDNPHAIAEQNLTFSLPLTPTMLTTPLYPILGEMGVAVNGIVFDPTPAEWYLGEFGSPWQYDPLGGAIELGVDENHAHVQPNGQYHYHAVPTGLPTELGVAPGRHSPLVGWSMDGYPIYAFYGWDDDRGVIEVSSSWVLRSGPRPSGQGEPGGTYDGTFSADYQYVSGAGNLDECNDRFAVTPEFPEGTYAYFITDVFPFIPRCFYRRTNGRDYIGHALGQIRPILTQWSGFGGGVALRDGLWFPRLSKTWT